mmetsp:Transcript_13368/g.28602  ORF Transcript_13368/g.28602 Transcript_13368/m.28602 type:complete len:138 (-) Transcript_13368:841-1254(-)
MHAVLRQLFATHHKARFKPMAWVKVTSQQLRSGDHSTSHAAQITSNIMNNSHKYKRPPGAPPPTTTLCGKAIGPLCNYCFLHHNYGLFNHQATCWPAAAPAPSLFQLNMPRHITHQSRRNTYQASATDHHMHMHGVC